MVKTLRDYALFGGIKDRTFVCSDDEYKVLDIKYLNQKEAERPHPRSPQILAKFMSGREGLLEINDHWQDEEYVPKRKSQDAQTQPKLPESLENTIRECKIPL
ncbi:MAG: hypothetical protein WC584_00370 [Candidatus Pacearchaeota archaeon]